MVNEKIQILQLLIENQENNLSIRQISRLRKINYKTAYNAVYTLKKEGIIDMVKFGNSISCKFNLRFNESVFLAESKRRNDLLKNKNIKIIHKDISQLPFSFIALLFGSYVKQKQGKHSDIDIMVIGGEHDKIKSKFSLYPNKIHLTLLEYSDFLSMAKSKEFSVVSEVIKKNIILIGIEDYYRLLENAG